RRSPSRPPCAPGEEPRPASPATADTTRRTSCSDTPPGPFPDTLPKPTAVSDGDVAGADCGGLENQERHAERILRSNAASQIQLLQSASRPNLPAAATASPLLPPSSGSYGRPPGRLSRRRRFPPAPAL